MSHLTLFIYVTDVRHNNLTHSMICFIRPGASFLLRAELPPILGYEPKDPSYLSKY